MRESSVRVTVDDACSDTTTIRRDLAAGAVALLSTDGAVRGFRFAAEVDPRDRNLLRCLFLAIRVQVDRPGAAHWTVVEPDAIGEATISVQRGPAPDGGEFIAWIKAHYAPRAC